MGSAPRPIRRLALACAALAWAAACAGDGGGDELPEGAFTVDATRFVTDAPAVGASWYDYDFEFHTVTPSPLAVVVRDASVDPPRFAALRVLSYYDEDTAVSGQFTLARATYDGDVWSAELVHVVSKNVREDGPACLDLFTGAEPDCASEAWQVQLRVVPLFVPEAGLVVGNPGIYLRSVAGAPGLDLVSGATVRDVEVLGALPDPTTLGDLADGPAASFSSTSWDRARFAPNLPRQGMAIGERLVGGQTSPAGDVFFVATARQTLLRVTMAVVDDVSLDVRAATAAFDADYGVYLPFGDARAATLAAPDEGELVFVNLEDDDLLPYGATADAVARALTPPPEREWDFVVERVGGALRVVLSPACAILNHTAEGGHDATAFDDAVPGATP